jgi:alpha-galactosidase
MSRLDDFTLNVLCNAEIIDVDQDPLGRQGRVVRQTPEEFILAKPLEDGSLAVGLFNLSKQERAMAVGWADLGLDGLRRVRDLWRQVDLKPARDYFEARIGAHGVLVVRFVPPTTAQGGSR